MFTTLLPAAAAIQTPAWTPMRSHAWNDSATAAFAAEVQSGIACRSETLQ